MSDLSADRKAAFAERLAETLDAAMAELLFEGAIFYPSPGVVEARKGAT